LRGVNLGGWLMMEGYILHAPNVAKQVFKKKFAQMLGPSALQEFEQAFRDNFITEKDLALIAAMGFNCVRVPFHYRIIEKAMNHNDAEDLAYLDNVIAWAKKHRLWVILDLHAAPGCQNHDWHADSLGDAELWDGLRYQDQVCRLWEFLAGLYREEDAVAGYDILNEPVTDNIKALNTFYHKVIKAIRGVDPHHILFIEGNKWARDVDCLEDVTDNNWALSIHFYDPFEFGFNLVPHLKYPMKGYDKTNAAVTLRGYQKHAERRGVPVFVGEFGVNYREGHFGEDKCLQDVLECFEGCGFHWTYWTFKAVKNAVFPDGIFSYYHNPLWVNRHGPKTGWENFAACWPKYKDAMIASWRTEEFRENAKISAVLKKAVS